MASRSLTIRGISDETLQRLRAQAARHHRSLNGEVLAVLQRATEAPATPVLREVAPAYALSAPLPEAADPAGARTVTLADEVDRDALSAICRQHHIRWLALFGSHARGSARQDSDVDVVVEFEPGMTPGFGIVRVAEALRPVFGGRRVDLVTRRGLAPRLRERILAEARELHAA